MPETTFSEYLRPTAIVDADHPKVIAYAHLHTEGIVTDIEKAVRLYYVVRDAFLYDPYHVDTSIMGLKASTTLQRGSGYCVEKACLLGALCRVIGIPSRFGFADVINHLSSEKLKRALRSDIFAFHGFVELHIEGRWVKATPAFNKSLCEKIGVKPLEFNGKEDSIFQPYSPDGSQFMEYVHDHGIFSDIPRELFIETLEKHYPHLFKKEVDKFVEPADDYFNI